MPKFTDVTILVTKRTLDALEIVFYHLAAFQVNFSVMFMDSPVSTRKPIYVYQQYRGVGVH